ncbi:ferritin-like domain-containing protein [Halorubrum lacusprofundi]|uniref:ferritin-like domain-containing protein n=1 Tax=Halorubrum lacusprofundi TaxID=2247 RepID=UPI000677BE5F|nr:ferritin-like domain-containing protein [Halorubrum lacusprofundi]
MVNPNEDDGERLADSAGINTRRQFMAGSAGALGGLALGGAFVGSGAAQMDDEEDGGNGEDGGEPVEEPVENEFEDDVDILNYARTLELLEASFYTQGLENIGEEAFMNTLSEGDPLRDGMFGELETIQAHEEAHAEALGAAVEELGGEPVEEPEFDFGETVEDPMMFLEMAAQIEDVGVSAYAGAAPYIENDAVLVPALGIHSVEARHASYLRTLNGDTNFPNVIDAPRSRSEVEEIVAPYIVGMEAPDDEEDEENGEEESSGEESGSDTPDNGTDTPDNGTDTPDNGTDTPDNGTDTPDNGTDTPDNGTDTPDDDTNTSS